MWSLFLAPLCGLTQSKPKESLQGDKPHPASGSLRGLSISNCCHDQASSVFTTMRGAVLGVISTRLRTRYFVCRGFWIQSCSLYVVQLSRSVNTSALRAGRDSTQDCAFSNHCCFLSVINGCIQSSVLQHRTQDLRLWPRPAIDHSIFCQNSQIIHHVIQLLVRNAGKKRYGDICVKLC